MERIPVEDDFNDILGKAQKGLKLATEELAEKLGMPERSIRDARRGVFEESVVASLAAGLELKAEPLLKIAKGEWYPEQPQAIDGFAMVTTPFYDMTVNAFLAWDPGTQRAIAFDTGTDAEAMVAAVESRGLNLDTIFITHTHGDHIACLEELAHRFHCKVACPAGEPKCPSNAEGIGFAYKGRFDGIEIEAMETTGHTEAGTSYQVKGLSVPIAVAGDALFAGSMGGANVSYGDSLAGLKRLLSLRDETVLAPGHGPLTTVGQEKRMNCFFSGSSGL
ncbi:MAG: MBL fold metallo-hydrolase [Verrucomicrobiota bacterium]